MEEEEEEEDEEVWKMEEEEEARREAKALRRTGEEARSFWVLVVVVAEVGEGWRGGREAKREVCGVFMMRRWGESNVVWKERGARRGRQAPWACTQCAAAAAAGADGGLPRFDALFYVYVEWIMRMRVYVCVRAGTSRFSARQ
jgi:hypothetical protein